ncbi:MAG: PAS domain-containing protein [Candidatus Altimarinota bacterium]
MYSNSELFQKIVTCMNEGIVLADEEGRILFVNPKFCELTGRKEKDLVGQDATSFYDERTAKKIKVIDRTQRKKGIRSSYEGTLITKSGDEVPVLISGTPLDQGGTFGVVTDLSEMKQKDNMYQKLVENMNEAVWVGDKNERTVYANPKFRNMMGYTLEEMLGKKSYDFWDEESCARVRHINETDRAKGKSSSYEGNLLTKKKERIPVLLSGAAIDHGTVGIMTDLRPLKEKEQK